MRDMLEVLKRAKQKGTYENKYEFSRILAAIQLTDPLLILDWDDGAGEDWARFYKKMDGMVCMINTSLKLVFVKSTYDLTILEHLFHGWEVVFTKDYCSDDWTVDVARMSREVPELYWHASVDAVNAKKFSLDDFYFATV